MTSITATAIREQRTLTGSGVFVWRLLRRKQASAASSFLPGHLDSIPRCLRRAERELSSPLENPPFSTPSSLRAGDTGNKATASLWKRSRKQTC